MDHMNLQYHNKLCNYLRNDPQVSSEKTEQGNLEFDGVKYPVVAH